MAIKEYSNTARTADDPLKDVDSLAMGTPMLTKKCTCLENNRQELTVEVKNLKKITPY